MTQRHIISHFDERMVYTLTHFPTMNSGAENRKEILLPLTFPEFYDMKTGARDLIINTFEWR